MISAHLHAQLGIEVRERFVEQEHLGVANDRPAHGDALALAAGELARIAAKQRLQSKDRSGRAYLGSLLNVLAGEFSVQRLVVAGGDTSGHALGELDICALTLRHPIPQSPGSPVCLGHRSSARQAAVEIVLKGGQIGKPDYFVRLRDGNL